MLDLFESRLVEATKENGHLWYETFFQALGKEKEEGDVYNFLVQSGSMYYVLDNLIQR